MPLPLIQLGLAGLSALAGGFGNRGTKLTSDQENLQSALIKQQMSLFGDPNLSGYEANQTEGINRNSELERKRLLETLASRGVTGDAVGFAESNLDRNRFGQINQLHQSIPLLARSLQEQAIGSGSNLFSSLRAGTPQQGNVTGGILGNLGTTLAYLYGQGAFNPSTPQIGEMGRKYPI